MTFQRIVIAPVADSGYCDYDPIKRKAGIGSSFLERE